MVHVSWSARAHTAIGPHARHLYMDQICIVCLEPVGGGSKGTRKAMVRSERKMHKVPVPKDSCWQLIPQPLSGSSSHPSTSVKTMQHAPHVSPLLSIVKTSKAHRDPASHLDPNRISFGGLPLVASGRTSRCIRSTCLFRPLTFAWFFSLVYPPPAPAL